MNIQRKIKQRCLAPLLGAVLALVAGTSQAEWYFYQSQVQSVHASALGGASLLLVINGQLCLLTGGTYPDRLQMLAIGLQGARAGSLPLTGTCADDINQMAYFILS